MRDLWLTIAHTSGARIYSMLAGVFTLILTARLLGPEGRGQVAAIITWVSMFAAFASLSLGQVAMHRMTEDREHARFGRLFGTLLLMSLLLACIGWVVAQGLYRIDSEGVFKGLPAGLLLLGFLSLPFMIWEQFGSSLLMAIERVRPYNLIQVVGSTISVMTVFVLVGAMKWGVAGVLIATLLGQLFVAQGGIRVLYAYARDKGSRCHPAMQEAKSLLSGGVKLHLNAIGGFLFTSANILILNHYHGAAQTAYLQLATQLMAVLTIIPQAASMSIFGKVTNLGPNDAWPINRRLLAQVTLGMAILGGLAALIAPWGIVLLAGESFRPAVELFQWMMLGLVGMTFSIVMGPQWIGRGYFWQAAGLTFLVGVINLVANLWLIPSHGMQGAIYAFLGTYMFSIFGNGAMALHCESQYRQAKASVA